jgi:hypothetical protein
VAVDGILVAVGSSSTSFDEQDTAIAIKVIAAMRISSVRSGLFTLVLPCSIDSMLE